MASAFLYIEDLYTEKTNMILMFWSKSLDAEYCKLQ